MRPAQLLTHDGVVAHVVEREMAVGVVADLVACACRSHDERGRLVVHRGALHEERRPDVQSASASRTQPVQGREGPSSNVSATTCSSVATERTTTSVSLAHRP